MLFFRSEEHVRRWCEGRGEPVRPILSMDTLWDLSELWYGRKLDADYERPGADEVRALFASVGLTGPFWDPEGRDDATA